MVFGRSKFLLCLVPLFLAGCGDGYEAVRTGEIFPYGNQRTAGTTIAYVRAKLLPEKELNLQPVERAHQPKAIEETQAILEDIPRDRDVPQPADQIFIDKQKK